MLFPTFRGTERHKFFIDDIPDLVLDVERNLEVQYQLEKPGFDVKDAQLRIFTEMNINVRLARQRWNFDNEARRLWRDLNLYFYIFRDLPVDSDIYIVQIDIIQS